MICNYNSNMHILSYHHLTQLDSRYANILILLSMFTGIIEDLAEVVSVKKDGTNLHIELCSSFTSELKIDQSVSHNGVCLTVVDIESNIYTVTAIKETLQKSNLGYLVKGSKVNTS